MIRKLRQEDATGMLEWMHDDNVTKYLRNDFALKTYEDCSIFIANSRSANQIHMAIADDNTDEYMGTASLKNIDKITSSAEFAIAVRKCAMGRGLAAKAMREILDSAHSRYDIRTVYWCVNPINQRAMRFYRKNKYMEENIMNWNNLIPILYRGGIKQKRFRIISGSSKARYNQISYFTCCMYQSRAGDIG